MKIAVIGKGKTGKEVIRLLGENVHQVFDRSHPVSVEALKGADAVIIFVPGENVPEVLPIIKASRIKAIWGCTGYLWPQDLNQQLKNENITWVASPNFSLGMQLIRKSLNLLGRDLPHLLPNAKLSIHEVHHIHKKDAPSGTALAWEKWLGNACAITSSREGDIKGFHELTISTPFEEIKISHDAKDRSVFAEGAIWAAEQIIKNKNSPGLHTLTDLIDAL